MMAWWTLNTPKSKTNNPKFLSKTSTMTRPCDGSFFYKLLSKLSFGFANKYTFVKQSHTKRQTQWQILANIHQQKWYNNHNPCKPIKWDSHERHHQPIHPHFCGDFWGVSTVFLIHGCWLFGQKTTTQRLMWRRCQFDGWWVLPILWQWPQQVRKPSQAGCWHQIQSRKLVQACLITLISRTRLGCITPSLFVFFLGT